MMRPMLRSTNLPRQLGHTLETLLRATLDWRPLALVALCILLIVMASQVPLGARFQIGMERGPLSDQPFIHSFYTPEGPWPDGLFRWTRGDAPMIEVPGIGRRPLAVSLRIVSHRANRDPAAPPTVLTIQSAEEIAPLRFTLRREAAHYQLFLPPAALPDGTLQLRLETETWQSPGDSRQELGVALGGMVTVRSLPGGVVLPDLATLTAFPLTLLILWPLVRLIGFDVHASLRLLLPVVLAVPLLLLSDPGRLGFGSGWAVQAALIGLASAAVCVALLPPLLRRAGEVPPMWVLRWLALIIVVGFALKYSARLYPDSMPGDVQLHINRYNAFVRGQHFIDAQHRGLPFPFPVGLYVLAAPLTIPGFDILYVFPLLAGVFEASGVVLVYLLLAKVAGSARLGVMAAAVSGLTPGGSMTAWYAFFSHISTQWYQVALVLLIAWRWPQLGGLAWWGLALLFTQVALGHIGTFINLAIFAMALVALLWLMAHSHRSQQVARGASLGSHELHELHELVRGRRGVRDLLTAGLAAAAFVFLTYYSVRLPQFVAVFQGITAEGMSAFTENVPIPRAESLRVVWEGGLHDHFGFFPVLLAIVGAPLLLRGKAGRGALPALILATVISSLAIGALPFITLSSITSRWLMFSAWVVAACSAPAWLWLWHRGRAGRTAVVGMAGYALWVTAVVWIEAMTMRLPPIEPF
jgi:hypothetical protein